MKMPQPPNQELKYQNSIVVWLAFATILRPPCLLFPEGMKVQNGRQTHSSFSIFWFLLHWTDHLFAQGNLENVGQFLPLLI